VLSIDRCRELLGEAARTLEDGELENLRGQLYGLAQEVVSAAKLGTAPADRARSEAWNLVPPDLLAEVHERAAIMEFDGGLSREHAERRALELVCGRTVGGARCRR